MGFWKERKRLKDTIAKSKRVDRRAIEEAPVPTYSFIPEGWPDFQYHGDPTSGFADILTQHGRLVQALRDSGVGEVIEHYDCETRLGIPFNVSIVVVDKSKRFIPVLPQTLPGGSLDALYWITKGCKYRLCDEFRTSPISIYSVLPIPEMLKYMYSSTSGSLFQSQLISFSIENIPLEEIAKRIVPLVKEFFNEELDFTPGSLHAVDRILTHLHWCEVTPVFIPTAIALGAYVGEIFRMRFGGRWCGQDSKNSLPFILLTGQDVQGLVEAKLHPLDKVYRQIQNHAGDEVSFYYEATENVISQSSARYNAWQ